MIASLLGHEDDGEPRCGKYQLAIETLLPVLPVVLFINCKVGDIHVISLPGTLVICQVFPFDQVVIDPLLVHAGRHREMGETVWFLPGW